MKNKLVICGGGIKGFCLLGYLQKLYENKILENIEEYCGTSVGSIICFLLLIGYNPFDILYILMEIDFKTLLKDNFDELLDNNHIGLYSSKSIMFVIKKLTKNKNISLKITFKELYEKFNKKIAITGVCLNDNKCYFFDEKNYPNMEVLTAIQISISIPLIFKPVEFNDQIWIDGGTLNNYPINYFENSLENVIGIKLKTNEKKIDKFYSQQEYFSQLFKCLLKSIEKENSKYDEITMKLFVDDINNFDINNEKKLELYNQGYNQSIEKFL